jgi:hypothetical protein
MDSGNDRMQSGAHRIGRGIEVPRRQPMVEMAVLIIQTVMKVNL